MVSIMEPKKRFCLRFSIFQQKRHKSEYLTEIQLYRNTIDRVNSGALINEETRLETISFTRSMEFTHTCLTIFK